MVFDSIVDMTLGMILGMVASPLMMRAIRNVKQKRRVNKILHDILELNGGNQKVKRLKKIVD
ncbi:MAG TPA: hypothetical protein VF884_00645 [Nitrososphaeraceae archaeon]